MKLLFSAPSSDDFIRLLKAWRFWLLSALVGGVLGSVLYYVVPPPYRARATVNVDFNLERAWPQETDRQQFYYLEREARKLEEVAWSDSVLKVVADSYDMTISELRDGRLILSQPAEAGWHFYAHDQDRQRASGLASTWAKAFAEQAGAQIGESDGLNTFIQLQVTQSAEPPVERRDSLGAYLLVGGIVSMLLGAIGILFFGMDTPAPRKKGRAKKKK